MPADAISRNAAQLKWPGVPTVAVLTKKSALAPTAASASAAQALLAWPSSNVKATVPVRRLLSSDATLAGAAPASNAASR